MIEFSFVIPTRDRHSRLDEALRALTNVRSEGVTLETVVVDDGSQPPVSIPTAGAAPSVALRIVRETSGAGPAAARNAGARNATGRVVVFVDDDCQVDPELLLALNRIYGQYPDALVGGRIVHGCPGNLWSTITHTLTEAAYEIQERRDRRPRRFSTSILAVPRERFLDLGGFDASFARPGGEDYEFCERWANHGGDARFASDASIVHYHPLTFGQFARQQINYGGGLMRSHREGRAREQHRSMRTKLRDVVALIGYPFTTTSVPRALPLAAGMVLSQLLTAFGALRELSRPCLSAAHAPAGRKS